MLIVQCELGGIGGIHSYGTYNGSTYATTYIQYSEAPGGSNSYMVYIGESGSASVAATVTTFNSTQFILSWAVLSGSPSGTAVCMWAAN